MNYENKFINKVSIVINKKVKFKNCKNLLK